MWVRAAWSSGGVVEDGQHGSHGWRGRRSWPAVWGLRPRRRGVLALVFDADALLPVAPFVVFGPVGRTGYVAVIGGRVDAALETAVAFGNELGDAGLVVLVELESSTLDTLPFDHVAVSPSVGDVAAAV